jgi:type III pantothenate kinase
MFIAIDVGNTNITIGVREDEEWTEHRINSNDAMPSNYYKQELAQIVNNYEKAQIDGVAISSVVPSLTNIIIDLVKDELHPKPVLLHKEYYHLLPITTANPEQMGTDLLANALAGYLKVKGPCLIVDFGTALTYTLVGPDNHIAGVAIAPGIKTAMQALSGNAAQLSDITLKLPEKPLGTNTVEAMNSGILWGFVGQVSYLIDKIKGENEYEIISIATGGLSEVLKPLEDKFELVDRNLTIQGIYEFFKLVKADVRL